MRIGFVAEPYEESHASGMGYVVLELMKHLSAVNEDDEFVVYSSQPVNKMYIPRLFRNVLIPKGFIGKFFFFLCLKKEVDVLLFVAPLLPFIIPRGIKAVIICQELGSQKIQPEGLSARLSAFIRDRLLMALSVRRASKVIAASEATQKDLLKFYHLPKEKVPVIYDGFQDLTEFAAGASAPDELLQPYFFFAGKVKYRKNVHGIVAAFIAFKKRTSADTKLVIAGDYGGEYHQAILRELEKNGLAGDVHFVGYASGAKLYSLYAHALAFVFPSINEGFGMPPIEAMSLGVPVITSKISSMVEVAGGAALLVDPFDIEDISRAMEKVYSDPVLRTDLIRKGFARAEIFSWSKAADAYLRLIRSL
jgi:glycosyltransferase involved in cell wall biosynthesis